MDALNFLKKCFKMNKAQIQKIIFKKYTKLQVNRLKLILKQNLL